VRWELRHRTHLCRYGGHAKHSFQILQFRSVRLLWKGRAIGRQVASRLRAFTWRWLHWRAEGDADCVWAHFPTFPRQSRERARKKCALLIERLRRAVLGTDLGVGQLVELVHDNSRLRRVQEGLGRVSKVEYVSVGRARLTVKQTLGGSVVVSAEAVRRVLVENDVPRPRVQKGQNGQAPAAVLVERAEKRAESALARAQKTLSGTSKRTCRVSSASRVISNLFKTLHLRLAPFF
jgi:hypothetical protein